MNLSIACGDYVRTRQLLEGIVGIDKHHLTLATFPPEEMFRRAFETAEFDISELSVSIFMHRIALGTCPYVAIPIFPARAFRHSAIYVRANGDVSVPDDLRGRKIGIRTYLNTAALVVRGLLADAHGVEPSDIHWVVGDVDDIERDTIPIPRLTRPVDMEAVPGVLLSEMLISGEIDALIHYTPPRELSRNEPRIKRLFVDPGRSEREYFRATGIFPIMHLIGIRRSLIQNYAPLARQVYDAFVLAKNAAVADPQADGSSTSPLPWSDTLCTSAESPAPQDFWPYGVQRNRAALESLTRYAFEQGLTDSRLSFEKLFVATLLDT